MPDLNRICNENCQESLLDCILNCSHDDVNCLSECNRDEAACTNGKLAVTSFEQSRYEISPSNWRFSPRSTKQNLVLIINLINGLILIRSIWYASYDILHIS